jgi:hypothetical protein
MTIYLLANKPHIAVINGFQPIDEITYYQMIENGEISQIEVVDYE